MAGHLSTFHLSWFQSSPVGRVYYAGTLSSDLRVCYNLHRPLQADVTYGMVVLSCSLTGCLLLVPTNFVSTHSRSEGGFNRVTISPQPALQGFQPSPDSLAECNVSSCAPFIASPRVSTLTRLVGRVQPRSGRVSGFGRDSFNPHQIRRSGATSLISFVSTLTRPEGRVQPGSKWPNRGHLLVSTLTRPEGQVQLCRSVTKWGLMAVSISAHLKGRALCNDTV